MCNIRLKGLSILTVKKKSSIVHYKLFSLIDKELFS